MSTTFIKKHISDGYNYRNSMDDSNNVTSSLSSSTTSSGQSYSPPLISTPLQRVPRKPVPNNRAAAIVVIKPLPQQQQQSHKNYYATDTVHPNKRITCAPVTAAVRNRHYPSFINNALENEVATATATTTKQANTTFWYPRLDNDQPLPLKRGLIKNIRGLLQPHKTQIEQGASNEQYKQGYKSSLKRCHTPDSINHEENPFRILSHTKNESEEKNGPPLQFNEIDFIQIDNYASTVQQRGPLLTPILLSQKFLTRPYREDLFRLRSLFIWLIQNIRPEYHQKRNDLILLQKQSQLSVVMTTTSVTKANHIRKRLVGRIINNIQQSDNHPITEKLDAMDLLQEETSLLLESSNDYINESADQVLGKRTCKSSFGMAHLFVEMAVATGFKEAKVVYGYLKAPKDTTIALENNKLPLNHAWCSVKIEGEYRFIDCWLASPFYPQNENKLEPHWFLTLPQDIIMTHLPKDPLNQFLNPPITQHAFFNLPHVRNPFFWYRMRILNYKNHLSCSDQDGVFYISLKLQESNINCYVETEGDNGSITRGLAQCLTDNQDHRLCKIKAVLPLHQSEGWLKIYAGPKVVPFSSSSNHQQQEIIHKNHYHLAMCIRITQPVSRMTTPFDFVQLYVGHNEFYVQEPQCHQLYPLQTYHFCIRGNRLDKYNRATHHKLAIKSPGGRLFKLMYFPQDQTYDGTVTISEAGKWSLICLLHHTGGWYTVASWTCNIIKK